MYLNSITSVGVSKWVKGFFFDQLVSPPAQQIDQKEPLSYPYYFVLQTIYVGVTTFCWKTNYNSVNSLAKVIRLPYRT